MRAYVERKCVFLPHVQITLKIVAGNGCSDNGKEVKSFSVMMECNLIHIVL